MIDTSAVLTASVVCLAGVMSPGPNFVAVMHRAVSAQRAEALAMVSGIACVSASWAAAALFGLGLLFALFPWLPWTAKLLGAAYLLWLGARLLLRAGAPPPPHAAARPQSNLLRAFRDGVVTNLSNPKSMAFYASVFSAAVPADASSGTLATLVAMVAVVAGTWYGGVALTLSAKRAAGFYRKAKGMIERGCGALLIGFGLRQALAPV